MGKTLAERFEAKVARGAGEIPVHCPDLGPCDLWTAGIGSHGYGAFSVDGVAKGAHVVAFFLAEGRWPNPRCLHRCDNHLCVRRSHLFEGTPADNTADMIRKGRASRPPVHFGIRVTSCPKGHPLEGDNLYVNPKGGRICLTCKRAANSAYKSRKRDRA